MASSVAKSGKDGYGIRTGKMASLMIKAVVWRSKNVNSCSAGTVAEAVLISLGRDNGNRDAREIIYTDVV